MGLSIIVYGRLPSGGRHSRERRNPATQCSRTLSEKTEPPPPSFPRRRESKDATQQEFIGKNRTPPPPSFPRKRESSNRKTTGIYQQKQKPHRRHSRKSGNPATEKPQESISKNRNPTASFPQKRESKNATQQEFIGKNRNPTDRHSRKSGNPDPSARKLTG
ncbi:putative phage associated protein [Neisseria meningitidis 96037]|nr:putative phage associated protein [Neisseria meningitidis 96037]